MLLDRVAATVLRALQICVADSLGCRIVDHRLPNGCQLNDVENRGQDVRSGGPNNSQKHGIFYGLVGEIDDCGLSFPVNNFDEIGPCGQWRELMTQFVVVFLFRTEKNVIT